MKANELDLMIRENVRSAIKENINDRPAKEEHLEESILLGALAGLSLGGFAWMSFRNSVRKAARSDAFEAFIESQDTEQLLSKKIPDLTRRFKLVNSLGDLETMERRTEEMIGKLEDLHRKIDDFVTSQDRLGGRIRDRIAGLSQQRLHQEIRTHLEDIIGATRKGFEQEIENRKDELLGEI